MGSTDLQFDKIRLKKKSTVTLSLEFIVDYFWDCLPTRNKFFKKYEVCRCYVGVILQQNFMMIEIKMEGR